MGCEVMCQPKKGHHRQRMGLMPDGSPCFKPNSDYKFPAHDKNVKYRCLKGVCQVLQFPFLFSLFCLFVFAMFFSYPRLYDF